MARCSKNRMGNGSNGWLTPSRRRTRGCQTAWWRLECEIAAANERVGRILLAAGSQKGNSGLVLSMTFAIFIHFRDLNLYLPLCTQAQKNQLRDS
jgi:hypothetical protein